VKQGKPGYEFREIMTCCGLVTALVRKATPWLAVHESPLGSDTVYAVTHVPSGDAFGNYHTRALAFSVAERLAPFERLEDTYLDITALRPAWEATKELIDSLDKPVKRTKTPDLPPVPVRLIPVYRPGFTPSGEVKSADRELAQVLGMAMVGQDPGEERFTRVKDRALDLYWVEEFMVRVPGLKASEVPPRPKGPRPSRLSDGTPCNYEGFKKSRAKLDGIGDQLLELSYEILVLADAYEANLWGDEERYDWITILSEFSRLAIKGWGEWTACVGHFIASTREEKDEVIAELGFVGSRKSGWREMGLKTFLRHPDIRKALIRRDVVKADLEDDGL
jgi:hypothetical protein